MPNHSTFSDDHAPLGQVDAANLLVLRGLAPRSCPLTFSKTGNLALEFLRLVQQRGNPQAGQSLVAQLLRACSLEPPSIVSSHSTWPCVRTLSPPRRERRRSSKHVLRHPSGYFSHASGEAPFWWPSPAGGGNAGSHNAPTSFCGSRGVEDRRAEDLVELGAVVARPAAARPARRQDRSGDCEPDFFAVILQAEKTLGQAALEPAGRSNNVGDDCDRAVVDDAVSA